ncbi:MAG: DNA polymerase, partial [Verrucomicrobiota bacterium]
GRAGTLLKSVLKQRGLDWNAITVLNAINCYAGDWPTTATARKKLVTECRVACMPYVHSVVVGSQPSVILAAGGEAVRSLTCDEQTGIPTHRGTVMDWNGVPMTGTHNPAGVLRGAGFDASVLSRDVQKVARWLNSGGPVPWVESWQAAPKPAELEALLANAPLLCIDVETQGPRNRWLCNLRTIGIGTADHAVCIPYSEWRDYYTEPEWLRIRYLLREALVSEKPKLFHHAQFDVAVLVNHGFEVGGAWNDTMIAHHVCYPRGVAHDLGYASAMFLDVPAWKSEFKKEWNAPFPQLAEYNCRDVLVTARLWGALQRLLWQRGLWTTYEYERHNARVALTMSRTGMWVDQTQRAKWLTAYQEKAAELSTQTLQAIDVDTRRVEMELVADSVLKWSSFKLVDVEAGRVPDLEELEAALRVVRRSTLDTGLRKKLDDSILKISKLLGDPCPFPLGDPETRQLTGKRCGIVRSAVQRVQKALLVLPLVNIASDQQMGEVLHASNWCGLPLYTERTKLGEYQTSKGALYPYQHHPVVEPWQAWKSAQHRVKVLSELPISADGRIHQAYKTHTTPTGRYAAGSERKGAVDLTEKYNAQNQEKDLYPMYCAPPGRVYVGGDFSQVELRVAAVISGDKRMLAMINDYDEGRSPDDLHTQMAKQLWPAEWAAASQSEQRKLRTIAKRANFGSIYGAQAPTLREVMKSMREPEESIQQQRCTDAGLLDFCSSALSGLRRVWVDLFFFLEEGYRRALREGRLKIGYITGRWIFFPLRDRDHIRREPCYNYPVQCTARERVIQAAMQIQPRLPEGAAFCIDVHDSLIIECDPELADTVQQIMYEEMNGIMDGPGGSVRILSEIKIGQTWREVK